MLLAALVLAAAVAEVPVGQKLDKINEVEENLDAMDKNLGAREKATKEEYEHDVVKKVKATLAGTRARRAELKEATAVAQAKFTAAQGSLRKITARQVGQLKDIAEAKKDLDENVQDHHEDRSAVETYASHQRAAVGDIRNLLEGLKR